MPKRPRQHILEDLARAKLQAAFASVGWTAEDLDKDYGEDLLVRIFEQGQATPWSFFVQSKATDHLQRVLERDGQYLAFRLKSAHARHWDRFWQPVVLAIFDSNSEQTYWEVIQTALAEGSASTSNRTILVRVPAANTLDEEGLKRLRNRTKRRFERFQAHKEGATLLIDILKEKWGVAIEYDPETGLLILPAGSFQADSSRGSILVVFGLLAARIERLNSQHGIEPQAAFESSLTRSLGSDLCRHWKLQGNCPLMGAFLALNQHFGPQE